MFLIDKNPNPSVETKPDTFSLDGLIAWMETKPAHEQYCFFDNGKCLLAQYAAHCGVSQPYVTTGAVFENGSGAADGTGVPAGREILLPGSTHWASTFSPLNRVASSVPFTFGEALNRARAWKSGVRT